MTGTPRWSATGLARRRRRAGFTLLEVLVALVIVALGMSALLETLNQSASNVAALREKTVAEWIAMNQIALARLALNAPTTGTTQGDVQSCANGNWHWQQQVNAIDAIPGLLSITVSVQRTGTATPNASQRRSTLPSGNTPGATGSLGGNVSLGPTAALGSVSSLSTSGCASFVAPGSTLGNGTGSGLGSMPSLGAGAGSLGAGPSSATSLGNGSAASIASGAGANLANSLTGANGSLGSSSSSTGSAGSSSGGPNGWLVTVTGFRGNALAAASGDGTSPNWSGAGFAANSTGGSTSSPNNPGVLGNSAP